MVAAYTSDDLLARIKARAQIPSTESRLTDSDILALADDSLRSTVGRIIYNADDGRWVKTQADVAITKDQASYRIPERAFGAGVYDVLIVDSAGNELSSPYVDSADSWRWRNGANDVAGPAYRHTIEGDNVVLLPTPTQTSGFVRCKYRREPSRLVPVASCARISGASPSSISVDSVPSGWGSAQTIDVVEGTPHGDSFGDDVSVTISGTTLLVSSGTFPGADAGDYACLAGETCVLPIPAAVFPFMVVLATYETLVALGDRDGAEAVSALLVKREKEAKSLVGERDRERMVVVNRSGHLRGAGRRSSRWGWWDA